MRNAFKISIGFVALGIALCIIVPMLLQPAISSLPPTTTTTTNHNVSTSTSSTSTSSTTTTTEADIISWSNDKMKNFLMTNIGSDSCGNVVNCNYNNVRIETSDHATLDGQNVVHHVTYSVIYQPWTFTFSNDQWATSGDLSNLVISYSQNTRLCHGGQLPYPYVCADFNLFAWYQSGGTGLNNNQLTTYLSWRCTNPVYSNAEFKMTTTPNGHNLVFNFEFKVTASFIAIE